MKFPWYWPEWQHKLWEKSRAHGKKGFMLRQALPWGIFMFVVMGMFQFLGKSLRGDEVQIADLAMHALVWTFGGWFYGVGSWYFGEKFYNRHITNQSKRTQ